MVGVQVYSNLPPVPVQNYFGIFWFLNLPKIFAFSDKKKIFCYYSSFAQSRPSVGKFLPEDIDPELCTHVIFAFVNMVGGRGLKPANWNDLTVDDRKGKKYIR